MPLLVAAALTGCKPPSNATADANPIGNYVLVSVNGNNVPCDTEHDGTKLTVKSGSFTIAADGTCSCTTVFVPPSGKEVNREVKATYTQEGAKLTMKWQRAGMTVGTVEGDKFTMNNEGMLFAYRKQT